jgi:transposase-like protein
MTTLVSTVLSNKIYSDENIDIINNILRQETINDAYELYKNANISQDKKKIITKLGRSLYLIPNLFSYKPDKRAIIGTTNLISYIGFHTQFLLDKGPFPDESTVLNSLNIVTRKILDNGKKLIPAWGKYIQPVEKK